MSALTLAIKNTLAQDAGLTALLASSEVIGPWIFDSKPTGARFELNSKCLIVISQDDDWTAPNEHNTLNFPQIYVDIWADPDRNGDPPRSVRLDNAQDKIMRIKPFVDKYLHLVDRSDGHGMPRVYGTAQQMTNKTGVVIVDSTRRSGPRFSPISNAEGAWMGRITYGVQTP